MNDDDARSNEDASPADQEAASADRLILATIAQRKKLGNVQVFDPTNALGGPAG